MFYDVKITKGATYEGNPSNKKINDIKALRECSRLPHAMDGMDPNGYRRGVAMGLTQAKAAIETMYAKEFATLRLTPEQFAAFDFNYRFRGGAVLSGSDWWIDDVTPYFEEQKQVFTF